MTRSSSGTVAHPRFVLGLNAFLHDSAAALLRDGELVAFAEEERFSRRRHTGEFPVQAIRWCLEEAGIGPERVDLAAFAWNPWLGLPRRFAGAWHRLFTTPRRLTDQAGKWRAVLSAPRRLAELGIRAPLLHPDHHLCHAAAVWATSPFDRSVVAVVDGAGELACSSHYVVEGGRARLLGSSPYPHSIGLVYGAVTEFLGFRHDADEGKTMGLAPWGRAALVGRFEPLLQNRGRGRVEVDLRYFDFGADWTTRHFEALFGAPRRPGDPIEPRHEDLAFALQAIVERVVIRTLEEAREGAARIGLASDSLGFAGGVALNSVLNGKILDSTGFRRLHLVPFGGDTGTALGAALLGAGRAFRSDSKLSPTPYLGPSTSREEIAAAVAGAGLVAEEIGEGVVERGADALAAGKIGGWFQGRMEVGPRALGNRSILADPRLDSIRDELNRRVKKREPFRPFAPSVPLSLASRWFEIDRPEPHMLRVVAATEAGRREVPGVVHIDGTARVQTVTADQNPRFHSLLLAFGERTGIPVLLNTSLNVAGDPIACRAGDAVRTFLAGGLDFLAIDDFWIEAKRGGGA
jgi:carbamoyltransferase